MDVGTCQIGMFIFQSINLSICFIIYHRTLQCSDIIVLKNFMKRSAEAKVEALKCENHRM